MRKVIKFKVLTVLLLIVFCSLLHSQEIIIDTVYSELSLEACVYYNTLWNVYGGGVMTSTSGAHVVGDWENAFVGGNCYNRSFFSYPTQEASEGFTLQSAYMYIYQNGFGGNSQAGVWPVWDINNQQYRYPCNLDHVDYGNTFSYDDFNCLVLTPNVCEIDSTIFQGWRNLDITSSYLADVDSNRQFSQYRFKFPVDTDYDYLYDDLVFFSSYSTSHIPHLVLTYIQNNGIDENELNDKYILYVFPNPVKRNLNISFYLCMSQQVEIYLYNIKGQKVKNVFSCNGKKGKNEISVNMENLSISNGIYFLKLEKNENKPITKKVIILK